MEPILHSLILVLAFSSNSFMDAIDFSGLMWKSPLWNNVWHYVKYLLFFPLLVGYGACVGKERFVEFAKDVWHPDSYMTIQVIGFVVAVTAWQFSYRKIFRPFLSRPVKTKYK